MSDYRAELQALIAACEDHYKWMLAGKFDGLHQAVQRARVALDGSAVPESWHIPRALSDETLRLLTSLPEDEIQRRLRMEPAAVEGQPSDEKLLCIAAEAIDGYGNGIKPGEYESFTESAVEAYGSELCAFARAVLARWGGQQPLRPTPVSERLPGDQLCWWFESDEDCGYGNTWTLLRIRGSATGYTHWLPANALPLPEAP